MNQRRVHRFLGGNNFFFINNFNEVFCELTYPLTSRNTALLSRSLLPAIVRVLNCLSGLCFPITVLALNPPLEAAVSGISRIGRLEHADSRSDEVWKADAVVRE